MVLPLADLITGGVSIIEKLIELHKINDYFKLIFGFTFTAFVGFCGGCGSNLVSGKSFAFSIGVGLLSSAGAVTALFVLNPRTKGIMIVQDKANMPDISNYQSLEKK